MKNPLNESRQKAPMTYYYKRRNGVREYKKWDRTNDRREWKTPTTKTSPQKVGEKVRDDRTPTRTDDGGLNLPR